MSFVISFVLLNQSYLLCQSSICAFIVNPLWPRPRPRPRTLLASLTSLEFILCSMLCCSNGTYSKWMIDRLVGCRFTHVVLDRVKVGVGSVGTTTFMSVLYLSTLEGVIQKLAVLPAADTRTTTSAVCLVEAIHLSERPRPGFIRSLQLHNGKVFG